MMSENWPEGKHYVETANLPKAFFDNVAQGGDSKLLFEKRDGAWHGRSWREISENVRRLATVLVECGVEPGERVLISAENRPEWAIADLAIMAVAIVVPATRRTRKMTIITSWITPERASPSPQEACLRRASRWRQTGTVTPPPDCHG